MIFDWSQAWQYQRGIVIAFGGFTWTAPSPVGSITGWVQVFTAANNKRGGS